MPRNAPQRPRSLPAGTRGDIRDAARAARHLAERHADLSAAELASLGPDAPIGDVHARCARSLALSTMSVRLTETAAALTELAASPFTDTDWRAAVLTTLAMDPGCGRAQWETRIGAVRARYHLTRPATPAPAEGAGEAV